MNDSQNQNPAGNGVGSTGGSASGPRLRCNEKWENGFYGTYRGHQVAIERDSRKDPWKFLVICPDGTRAADGMMRERTTMREAIIYALRGALLWPNVQDWTRRRPEKLTHGRG